MLLGVQLTQYRKLYRLQSFHPTGKLSDIIILNTSDFYDVVAWPDAVGFSAFPIPGLHGTSFVHPFNHKC
jgi:hypothetical protein